MDPQWLDVAANVFSAVGTVGAFAIGFVLLRQEHQREAERSEDERRAQAVRVSAWVEATRTAHGGRELAFHVHNASDMPIYEVSLPLPAVEVGGEAGEAEFIGLVPPGQTVTRLAPREWLKTYFSPEPVEVEFLDSGGHQWTRDEQGVLTVTRAEALSEPAAPRRWRRLYAVRERLSRSTDGPRRPGRSE